MHLPFRIFKLRGDGSPHFVGKRKPSTTQKHVYKHWASYGPASTSFTMRQRESGFRLSLVTPRIKQIPPSVPLRSIGSERCGTTPGVERFEFFWRRGRFQSLYGHRLRIVAASIRSALLRNTGSPLALVCASMKLA